MSRLARAASLHGYHRLLSLVMETAVSVVDKAMRIVGGGALFRTSPLEQSTAMCGRAIIHQPFAGYEGLGTLGKLVFGIPQDVMPRWL